MNAVFAVMGAVLLMVITAIVIGVVRELRDRHRRRTLTSAIVVSMARHDARWQVPASVQAAPPQAPARPGGPRIQITGTAHAIASRAVSVVPQPLTVPAVSPSGDDQALTPAGAGITPDPAPAGLHPRTAGGAS